MLKGGICRLFVTTILLCGFSLASQGQIKLMTLDAYLQKEYGTNDATSAHALSAMEATNSSSDYDWIIYGGAILAKNAHAIDVGVMKGSAIENFAILGYKLGSEFSLNKNFYIAPKVGFEMSVLFVSARVNLVNYTNFKRYEPKFRPEIGLSIVGIVNFTYGYNVSLVKRKMENVPIHMCTISVNIPLSTHYLD